MAYYGKNALVGSKTYLKKNYYLISINKPENDSNDFQHNKNDQNAEKLRKRKIISTRKIFKKYIRSKT